MKATSIVLLMMLLVGGIALTSCNRSAAPANTVAERPNGTDANVSSTPAAVIDPDAPVPADKDAVATDVSLSVEAKEISLLLDKGSYKAADTLLNNYLPRQPNDATLYCQYVRFLIGAYELAEDPYISTPIKTDDKYKTSGVIAQSIGLASEFNPKVKSYLAEIVLQGLYDQMNKKAVAGEGYITTAAEIVNPTGIFSHANKILLAWSAIELDPNVGKKWADKYESLVPVFVRLGLPTSAMWTANLSADLSNGADKSSDLDFERATRAFLEALDSRKCKLDAINSASTIYTKSEIFGPEIKKAASTHNATYLKLLNAIKREGGDLKVFEAAGVLPPSLMSNSNTASPSRPTTLN